METLNTRQTINYNNADVLKHDPTRSIDFIIITVIIAMTCLLKSSYSDSD